MAAASLHDLSLADLRAEVERRGHRMTYRDIIYQRDTEAFLKFAARTLNVTVSDLLGRARTADTAARRHVAVTAMRQALSIPLSAVARAMNRKDHATIINSVKAVSKNPSLIRAKDELLDLWKRSAHPEQKPAT